MERLQRIRLLQTRKKDNQASLSDELIALYVDIIDTKIMKFCNRNDMPADLQLLADEMIAAYLDGLTTDLLNDAETTESQTQNKSVESIKRGDTTISYGQSMKAYQKSLAAGTVEDFVISYKEQLWKWRKAKSV